MTRSSNITKSPARIWLDDDDHASALTAGLRLWASNGISDARIILNSPCLAITHSVLPLPTPLPDGVRTPTAKKRPTRRPRKPTLTSVAKQANKAAIDVARYEVKPDGTVVVVTGAPEPAASENPWPLDEFQRKDIKQ